MHSSFYLSVMPETNDFLLTPDSSPKSPFNKIADIAKKAKQSDLPHHKIVELVSKARDNMSPKLSHVRIKEIMKKRGHRRSKSDSMYFVERDAPICRITEEGIQCDS